MGWFADISYKIFMFPFETALLTHFRKLLIKQAAGHVLEIGAGTGVNLKYYKESKVDSLKIIDRKLSDSLKISSKDFFTKVELIEGDAESLPFSDGFFDSIVFTLVFCSVADPIKGLAEVRRVLKDNGKIIFMEHVKPDGGKLIKVTDKINAHWNSFSSGCNLNRETLQTIKSAGFALQPESYRRKGVFITGVAGKI